MGFLEMTTTQGVRTALDRPAALVEPAEPPEPPVATGISEAGAAVAGAAVLGVDSPQAMAEPEAQALGHRRVPVPLEPTATTPLAPTAERVAEVVERAATAALEPVEGATEATARRARSSSPGSRRVKGGSGRAGSSPGFASSAGSWRGGEYRLGPDDPQPSHRRHRQPDASRSSVKLLLLGRCQVQHDLAGLLVYA